MNNSQPREIIVVGPNGTEKSYVSPGAELVIRQEATADAAAEIARLRAAAGNAASILSRHLSHQLSHQDSHTELRAARDGLVAVLSVPQQPSPDKCAACGYPRKEHSYNGACYGICGKFVGRH